MSPEEACNFQFDFQKHYGYVYCLTFPNGKRYVGQSKRRWKDRWKNHKCKTSDCRALRSALQKYGTQQLEWQMLCYADSLQQLTQKQSFYIKQFNTLSPNGYNISLPDRVYCNPQLKSDRIRIGIALHYLRKKDKNATVQDAKNYIAERERKECNKVKKGTPQWIEQCKTVARLREQKIRQNGGRKNKSLFHQVQSKKMKVYETGQQFGSITQFCKRYGVPASSVSNCLNMINKKVHGLHVYFSDITEQQMQRYVQFWNSKVHNHRSKVKCIQTGQEFDTPQCLADKLGISVKRIYDIVRYGREFSGFHFEFI